jgi:hypothetical protein
MQALHSICSKVFIKPEKEDDAYTSGLRELACIPVQELGTKK